jgi:hypothetical protein
VAGHLLFETLGIAEAQDDDLGAIRAGLHVLAYTAIRLLQLPRPVNKPKSSTKKNTYPLFLKILVLADVDFMVQHVSSLRTLHANQIRHWSSLPHLKFFWIFFAAGRTKL